MNKIKIIVFHKQSASNRTTKKKLLYKPRYLFLKISISSNLTLTHKQRSTSRNQR